MSKYECGALRSLASDDIAALFHNGITVVMLIDRKYGNSHKGSRRWINKLISWDKESFETNVDQLIKQQDYLNSDTIRLYASLNYRSMDKGIKRFFHTLLDVTHADRDRFWCNINANFVSSIMQPESRVSDTKRWLLDIDTDDLGKIERIMRTVEDQDIIVQYEYPTVKGRHVIVAPFNKMQVVLPEWVELKQDGLVLLRAIGDK